MQNTFDLDHEFVLSERIVLRPLSKSDASELFALVDQNRAHLEPWLPWVESTTKVEDSRAFIEHAMHRFDTKHGIAFGIFLNGNLSGVCGLQQVCWDAKTATVGYWLAQSSYGQGVMRSCLSALTDLVFQRSPLELLVAEVDPKNGASRYVCEKAGYKMIASRKGDSPSVFLKYAKRKRATA